jgi:hypothetical protein
VLTAVEEFIAASDRIRLARRFAAGQGREAELDVPSYVAHRVIAARARCVEAGLWDESRWSTPARLVNRCWYGTLTDGRCLRLVRVRTGPHESLFQHWLRTRRVA